MDKICTSIEQSKKLIELGIDVNTANFMWEYNPDKETYWNKSTIIPIDDYVFVNDIPAWSLVALLNIIKPINENTYTIRGTLDGGATISFDEITNVMFQEEEIIDAVFEMVCWLKKNGKI